ncbi:serine/threonine-protein kinase RsbW [Nocardioides zeae]|uniref:Serine/threonine-protein kinase RsbW n=1 Tax=Nocardioides zeae TaxID=1457234 RepID=A0ACC6IDI0_9ACTN|nr:ATP-binding protein [Nocardioides zeae]MDR6175764.1 serine/threonine-protein kinase RsbW [Nocardioides zeae]MDR6208692.1 serine/threonine-protein kinase RsbW [Nocardioides zeae]
MTTSPLSFPPPGWHVVDVPHSDEAARRTCDVVRGALEALHLPTHVLNDAVIVAGELVINAVEHGSPGPGDQIELAWSVEPSHVVLRVTDGGAGPAITVQPVSDDGLRGRGLAMVAAICDDWSVTRATGTTVTARIAL